MSIVIRDLVEVVDVLSSDVVDVNALLLDLPEDEPELPVVINKFFPDKFALTSLNCIEELELLDESSMMNYVFIHKFV